MATTQKPYLIDADSFMQAARSFYSFDLAKPLWEKLPQYGADGKILSIDKVFKEIDNGNDELKKWANGPFRKYFEDSKSSSILNTYGGIIAWAGEQRQYLQGAKNEFMIEKNADPWLVSYASVNKCTVVTFEKSRPASKKRIFIPDVCDAHKVDCCDFFTMLRKLGFQFRS